MPDLDYDGRMRHQTFLRVMKDDPEAMVAWDRDVPQELITDRPRLYDSTNGTYSVFIGRYNGNTMTNNPKFSYAGGRWVRVINGT